MTSTAALGLNNELGYQTADACPEKLNITKVTGHLAFPLQRRLSLPGGRWTRVIGQVSIINVDTRRRTFRRAGTTDIMLLQQKFGLPILPYWSRFYVVAR